jgi:hypothetical protein
LTGFDRNFRPTLVSTYESAFAELGKLPLVDAMVCDMGLDRSSPSKGVEMLKKLRAGRDIPLIALSTQSGVDEASIRAGAELSITRPANPEALQDVIESVLIKYRLLRERHSCFISYSNHDDAFAQRLHDDLRQHGVQCWYAAHDLAIGAKTRSAIHQAIENHDKMLLILSRHSVESNWVEDEVAKALELESRQGRAILFPIRLDDAVLAKNNGWPATIRNTRNIGDFTKWRAKREEYQFSLERLLRDLKKA